MNNQHSACNELDYRPFRMNVTTVTLRYNGLSYNEYSVTIDFF